MYGSPNPPLCKLCLTKKVWIINFINDENVLNKKSELISKCRHLYKHLLRNVKKKYYSCNFIVLYQLWFIFLGKINMMYAWRLLRMKLRVAIRIEFYFFHTIVYIYIYIIYIYILYVYIYHNIYIIDIHYIYIYNM